MNLEELIFIKPNGKFGLSYGLFSHTFSHTGVLYPLAVFYLNFINQNNFRFINKYYGDKR